MQIIQRKYAKLAGLTKYFTGRECKNGHVDVRYTASGACKSCVHGVIGGNVDPAIKAANLALMEALELSAKRKAALHEAKTAEALRLQEEESRRKATAIAMANAENTVASARVDAKAQLQQVRVRCYDVDVALLKASAHALALARFPSLMLGDVWPGLLPVDKAAGTAIHKVNVHPEDGKVLQEIAASLIRAKVPDMEAARRQIHTALQEATPAAPVPGWADRP